MIRVLRWLFFGVFARLIVLIVLGLNVRHRERLPSDGPAMVIGNHNSHLDTLVLMTLLPQRLLPRIRPVAAADYFLARRWLSWFAINIVGIIPLERQSTRGTDPLAACSEALARGDILILYPEGTRGEPEQLGRFKSGIAHLAARHPDVPMVPVFMKGLGRALPKGEALLVPFFCDVFVGEAIRFEGNRRTYMSSVQRAFEDLRREAGDP